MLVAGPIYQAAIELDGERVSREDFERAVGQVEPPERSSPWWWLIPPVGYWKQQRQSNAFRQSVTRQLTSEQMEGLMAYLNKANAWFYVGAGATLIATKETWELVDHFEWPVWVFVLAVVAMFSLAAFNTAARIRGTHEATAKGSDPEPETA